jgi:hypothetical protein
VSVVRRLSSLEVDSDRGETVICQVRVLSGSRTGACSVPLTLEPTTEHNVKPVTCSSHHFPKLQLQYSQKLATGSCLEPLEMCQSPSKPEAVYETFCEIQYRLLTEGGGGFAVSKPEAGRLPHVVRLRLLSILAVTCLS